MSDDDIVNAALADLEKGSYGKAAETFLALSLTSPENARAHHFAGIANWRRGWPRGEVEPNLLRSLELNPNSPAFFHNYGAVLSTYGQIAESETQFRRAIALAPDYVEAYFNLCNMIKVKADEPALIKMRSLYAAGRISKSDREFLCFALAKAYDDIGDGQAAIRFCLEAKWLANRPYDLKALRKDVAEAKIHTTKAALVKRDGRGHRSLAPIFIVGMARSGTTLVETILSRHTEINVAGETRLMDDAEAVCLKIAQNDARFKGGVHAMIAHISDAEMHKQGSHILNQIKTHASNPNYSRFVDKLPRNALRLGLISQIFPNARVIYMRRHPLDCCASNLFHRFSGEPYAYNMITVGKYYRALSEIMDHWRQVLPIPILTVQYEDVVEDLEGQARRLIDFIGLDWQEACLTPEKSDRDVRTASVWQVRQPVNSLSTNRWKKYQPWLEPLIESMGGMEWIEQEFLNRSRTNQTGHATE